MKKLVIFLIGVLFYQNSLAQNLKLEVINKTKFDIDSIAIYDQHIGLLKKESSVIIESNGIILRDGLIMGLKEGYIKGKKRYPTAIECLNGNKTKIETGHLILEITMIEDRNGYWLHFEPKL